MPVRNLPLERGSTSTAPVCGSSVYDPRSDTAYRAVHNFCTSQKAVAVGPGSLGGGQHRGGGNLSHPHGSNVVVRDSNMVTAHLLGEDLYMHLIEYLKNHLSMVYEKSKQHVDEALLTFYIREWKRYTTAASYNNHLFRYLNRHWVKREIDEGKKNVYDIYTLHLVKWKEHMFEQTHKNVMASVLKLVEKQRNGETVEYSQIKAIVECFGA